ncbi:hypothetical protein C0991_003494 [Blastosporella zonata]|nr:hypothetical protein C0991_003494 [Blastosporella zonata]
MKRFFDLFQVSYYSDTSSSSSVKCFDHEGQPLCTHKGTHIVNGRNSGARSYPNRKGGGEITRAKLVGSDTECVGRGTNEHDGSWQCQCKSWTLTQKAIPRVQVGAFKPM